MGLLREWAERADAMGIKGTLVDQILKDENFEQNVLDAFTSAAQPLKHRDRNGGDTLKEATTSDFGDLVGKDTGVDRALLA